MVKVQCHDCGNEYELRHDENTHDFQCECGGDLSYSSSTVHDHSFYNLFRFFDLSSKENRINLKYFVTNQDFVGSVVIGVIFSMLLSVIFFTFSSIGFRIILHSFPIKYLPLLSAGIVAAYVFKGQDLDLFKTSAIAGIVSAILNTIGNLFIIILFNSLFLYELNLIAIFIFVLIDGFVLGVIGGFIIYLYKKVVM